MKRRWTAPARLRAGITLAAGLWAMLSWSVIIAAVFVDGPIGARIFCAIVLFPVGALSARIMVRAQMGFVAIGPDNVRIAGLVRSRSVPLDEVDRFVIEPDGSFGMSQVALKRLKGRRYMLWVTGRGAPPASQANALESASQPSVTNSTTPSQPRELRRIVRIERAGFSPSRRATVPLGPSVPPARSTPPLDRTATWKFLAPAT